MNDSPEQTPTPRSLRAKEYEDPHFHDDDLELPPSDDQPHGSKPRTPRKSVRRPPPRRHYEE